MWIRIREIEQSVALIEQILAGLPEGSARISETEPTPRLGEGLGLPSPSVAMFSSGFGSMMLAASPGATCVIRPGFNGHCWRRRLKETSSPTFRSATSRSTAPIRGTISRLGNHAQAFVRKHGKTPFTEAAPLENDAALVALASRLESAARQRLGRSLSIREVDAGSCNGCELEIHALNNVFYDLERLGLRFVASPRHADVLLVTGPVTKNMREALERTYNATPDPKWVVAVGDCAVDGGIFASKLCRCRRRFHRRPGRPSHPRLSADPASLA